MRAWRRRKPHVCEQVELVLTVAGQEVMRASLEHLALAGKYAGPMQLLGDEPVQDLRGKVVRLTLQRVDTLG